MLIFSLVRLSRVRLFEHQQTFTIFGDFIHLENYHVSFMKIIRLN